MSIRARYRISRQDFELDVRFSVPARGVSAIFGPSGSGKTTLLRALAGLERGPIEYLEIGSEIWQDDARFLPPHKRPVGFVFQEASLFPHLSVEGNLRYGQERIRGRERLLSFEEVVTLLGVETLLRRRTTELSGGERKRVAISRALLASPRLLLLDEPLSGLDRESRSAILPYLDRLHEALEIPVFYVSHEAGEVARLADHLLLIDAGKIVAAGPVAEMLTRIDLPLAHGDRAEAIVEARVESHDDRFALTYLEFPGGVFTVARLSLPVGRSLRLRILARDVSLTIERQTGTSILNVFPVTVEALSEDSPSQVVVRLDAAGVTLLARITHKSVEALGIRPGARTFAQIKSVAVLA